MVVGARQFITKPRSVKFVCSQVCPLVSYKRNKERSTKIHEATLNAPTRRNPLFLGSPDSE